MHLIFRTEFGSTVYGTRIPTSDTDYKSVYIPKKRDLYLSRANPVINLNTKADKTLKNSSEDIDDEIYSFHKFLKLLCEGQTPIIDMLFTPNEHWKHNSWQWENIVKNKDKFISKQTGAFVHYCQAQAAKYGIKGSRVGACRKTLEFLKSLPNHSLSLTQYTDILQEFIKQSNDEFIQIVMIEEKDKGIKPYLECCNRKCAFNANVKYAISIYQHVFDAYGHRALQAEQNLNCDWKALNHAVRIANQAQELLLTGNVTFPRPEKDLLLRIRTGQMPYKQVAELIEEGLEKVEAAKLKSTLRETADIAFMEDFVYNVYLNSL